MVIAGQQHRFALSACEQALGISAHGWCLVDVELSSSEIRLTVRQTKPTSPNSGANTAVQIVTLAPHTAQPAFLVSGDVALSYVGATALDGVLDLLSVIAEHVASGGWRLVQSLCAPFENSAEKRIDGAPARQSRLERQLIEKLFIPMDVSFDPRRALAEILALRTHWHTEKQRRVTGQASWWSLPLRTRGARIDHGWYFEPTGPGRPPWMWTEHHATCPATAEIIEDLIGDNHCQGVHAMVLQGGGRVIAHSDEPNKPCSVSISAALSHPAGCTFTIGCDADGGFGDEACKVPFEAGRAFVVNVASYHRIDHHGDGLRVHLVIRAAPKQP